MIASCVLASVGKRRPLAEMHLLLGVKVTPLVWGPGRKDSLKTGYSLFARVISSFFLSGMHTDRKDHCAETAGQTFVLSHPFLLFSVLLK